ncbi:putative alpha-E superfamily protein [Pseudochelatococcus lubricantis]|uniref:Alpha-E superfamily protein n=1 Tax=Pseudochelatococcus lubricantis TaxID=1538102 RepID=A0ABX0UZ93_9HYPH|nr:alpha-E domain-containing protein [Pseudochelatococcus lubricantis]NIJ58278.1 putative alpha-E superfamily protein [Pseudochelatococcus lubricantis]
MLSRTADNIYWSARYLERADFQARILDACTRLTSLPASYAGASNAWEGAIASTGGANLFRSLYDRIDEWTVRDFIAFNPGNPSSISNCLMIARNNARAVRTALTSEMWEVINDAWLELKGSTRQDMDRDEIARFIAWVKGVTQMFEGAAHRTMLRNDAYYFTRIGGAIERADNTARILDVKYHLLLPVNETVGGGLDYFQWTTILREVSALTAYHWVYRESVKPWLIADLLILNRQMPRSLASCYEALVRHFDLIAETYGQQGECQRLAGATLTHLRASCMESVFQEGLHEFVTGFIGRNHALGDGIARQYLLS